LNSYSRRQRGRLRSVIALCLWGLALGLASMMSLGLSGCVRVQPYEREYLADPLMQIEEYAEDSAYELHIPRALTQGTTGQAGAGGSGCGCEQ
jgi:hypothetical protein